jgi:cobalamin biosynthetic protein CobC
MSFDDGLAPLLHGGDLATARRLFPGAPEPFIDLSTGINPHSFPVPHLPPEVFTRLPEPAAVERLAAVAARAYGAPSAEHVVAVPGTQIVLAQVAALVSSGRAVVLGPTYAEHPRAAALAGHAVNVVEDVAQLAGADLAIVVNPNNPDGRIVERSDLLALADELASRRGLLVVDEAFMEVGPPEASLAAMVGRGNIVVLRSFSKFFGLAGLRLGFVLAAPALAARLRTALGPWAVSGPAIAVGETALADDAWSNAMRGRLATEALRLGQTLRAAGFKIIGNTSLFCLVSTPRAGMWFDRLGGAGILVRCFDDSSERLRVGLPPDESAWRRLSAAVSSRG